MPIEIEQVHPADGLHHSYSSWKRDYFLNKIWTLAEMISWQFFESSTTIY